MENRTTRHASAERKFRAAGRRASASRRCSSSTSCASKRARSASASSTFIKERPGTSLLIAAAAGYLIGRIVRS